MTIEEKIGLFAELSEEERREVEHYVAEHGDDRPDLNAALAEAKRIHGFLRAARMLGEDPPTEEALAYYAVMRRIDSARRPDVLDDALVKIEERISRSPELQKQLADIEAGADALSSDAEAQFAALVGSSDRSGDALPADAGSDDAGTSRTENASDAHQGRAERPSHDEGRMPSRRTNRRVRRTVAALLIVATAYAGLFVMGRAAQPEHERLVRFRPSELELEGYDGVRGDGVTPGPSSVGATYLGALEQLRRADGSFLGLFPRLEVSRLDSAANLLENVIEREPPESFLTDEAAFLLGKVELARGNIDSARGSFERVAAGGGRRAGEAEVMLQRMSELEE